MELRIAAMHEAVVHLDDLLLRRTRLGLLLPGGALGHVERIRLLTEPWLRWGDAVWQAELGRYRELIERQHAVPPP